MKEGAEAMVQSVSNASIAYFGAGRRFEQSESRQLDPRQGGQSSSSGPRSESTEGEKKDKLANPKELTPAEKQQGEELKLRDAEVRTHEAAHLAAAGSLAQGGPNYVFQTGPDGKHYAIGGDVQIDTSPGRTPEETLQKAQTIRAAALAPADPSPQDLKVAASAARMEAQAAAKIAKQGNPAEDGEVTSARQLFQGETVPAADIAEPGNPLAARAAALYRRSSGY